MARGKPASPNLTCIPLQLIRRQHRHTAWFPAKKCICPIWGASRGDGGLALYDAGSSK